MACARQHHVAPLALAEITVLVFYKHFAPLGLVSIGGLPCGPTLRVRGGGPVASDKRQRRAPVVLRARRVGPAP